MPPTILGTAVRSRLATSCTAPVDAATLAPDALACDGSGGRSGSGSCGSRTCGSRSISARDALVIVVVLGTAVGTSLATSGAGPVDATTLAVQALACCGRSSCF